MQFENLPHKNLFEAVGIKTIEEVLAFNGDYSKVDGIGPAKQDKINEFLNNENQTENTAEQSPEPVETEKAPADVEVREDVNTASRRVKRDRLGRR